MMRTTGSFLKRLLPAVVALATVSCGAYAAGTSVPRGSAAPGAAATSAAPATSPAPGATATRRSGASSVIFGVVQAAPTCPVDPVYHACRPHPLGAVEVQARSPAARLMASTRTGANGHYSLHLGPGSYVLVVVITQVFPRCPRVLVSIGPGAAMRANISCDTGMRHLGPPATNPA